MGKTKRVLDSENFVLRRKLRIAKATLILARAERDAARNALARFNYEECLEDIRKNMGLKI